MASPSSRARQPTAVRRGPQGLVRLYLFAYNVASLAGWSFVLYRLKQHLDSPTAKLSYRSLFPGGKEHLALLDRSKTSYNAVGDLTQYVQTGAILEVLHVLVGFVRSGLGTTAAQVASRLVLVWGILIQFPQVRSSPIFSTMVFAWSVAEMVRYSTYALALFNIKLYPLEWLRYTLFYVLYPLGAGSEAYLMYLSLPYAKRKYGQNGVTALVIALCIWPVALVGLMSHMHAQRRKFTSGKPSTGAKAKKRA